MTGNNENRSSFSTLLVDDEMTIVLSLRDSLLEAGIDVVTANTGEQALAIVEEQKIDVVVTDVRMPGLSGLELLSKIKQFNSDCEVIVMTAYGNFEHAVAAIKMGAYDYVTKPIEDEKIVRMVKTLKRVHDLRQEVLSLRTRLTDAKPLSSLVGSSKAWRQVVDKLHVVAPSDSTVLIQGPSGTGKEMVANTLHDLSGRKGEFIKVHCAALPATLMESELFGHVKGSFTGATRDVKGRFEAANHGTLLLDEVDEIPLEIQVKLLRVLQERVVEKVGSTRPIEIDIRLIATTKTDLRSLVDAGTFREDLFYRLTVVDIVLPRLVDRRSDIPLLIEHFVRKIRAKTKKSTLCIEPPAIDLLNRYHYPGNVRELENIVESACVLCGDGHIKPNQLPEHVRRVAEPGGALRVGYHGRPLAEAAKEFERSYLEHLLREFKGSKTELAGCLGISRKALWKKLKDHDLQRESGSDSKQSDSE